MKNVLSIIVVLLFLDSTPFGCTCLPSENAREELGRVAAVWSGKVIEVKRHEQERNVFMSVEAVIEVDRVWKGVEKRTVSVFTSSESSACGYGFQKGEAYLVYASKNTEGRLITSICSRTRILKAAQDDLKELGEGKAVAKGKEN